MTRAPCAFTIASMTPRPLRTVLLTGILGALLLAPTARATTTGGHWTGAPVDPVVVGQTALWGIGWERQNEYGSEIEVALELRSLALPSFAAPIRRIESAPAHDIRPIALAGGATAGAVAWPVEGGLASAMVDVSTLALGDRVVSPVSGELRRAAVHVLADDAGHVVAWTDDGGLHVSVADGGIVAEPVLATPAHGVSFRLTATADGAAWLIWQEGAGLRALRLGPGTASTGPIDVGSADGGWQQRASAADGTLWILARGATGSVLRRVGTAGAVDIATIPQPRAFLDVDGAGVVVAAQGERRGRAILRRFGPTYGRTRIRLGADRRMAGFAIEPDGTAHLLARRPDGLVLITPGRGLVALAKRGTPSSLVAGPGVTALTTTKRYREYENEDGGGSSPETMHYDTLHVVARDGRVARSREILNGSDYF
jgi:hypothetical protein